MSLESTLTRPAERAPVPPRRRLAVLGLAGLAANVAVLAAVWNVRRGAVADRIANRAVDGAPRPVGTLFGKHNWVPALEFGTVLAVLGVVVLFVVMWRRHPRHPVLLMALAATGIVWLDPVMNWAPYAVYNPQLTHLPETWPLVSLSPTVEPFIVLGYVTFYLGPYFPASWLLRRLQARRPARSFVSRHPLLTMTALIIPIGFVYDALLEIFCIRTGLYIYSHVVPFGSVFTGHTYQFPLLWESLGVCLVMVPAGLLLYRDDTGRTRAERLAQRVRFLRGRPALATFLVMFALMNAAYAAYGAEFGIIRGTGSATSVACPWPYPEAKVYDPQGFYAKAGQPGPYFAGNWAGWETGQSGRPAVAAAGGRCAGRG